MVSQQINLHFGQYAGFCYSTPISDSKSTVVPIAETLKNNFHTKTFLRWLVPLVQFSKKNMKRYPVFSSQILNYQRDQIHK